MGSEKITKEDIVEILEFLDSEGILTIEDKYEIFVKKNVDRLKTLAYLCMEHIKKKLSEDEISKFKEGKYKRILSTLSSKNGNLMIATACRDFLNNDEDFEKIIGE